MDDDKQAELLLDHYKDTFQHIQSYTKIRNRLFMYNLILLAVIVFDACSPGSLSELLNAYIEKSLSKKIVLDFNIIFSAMWFILLCLIIEYYKRSINIDRQLRYLGDIEKKICEAMGGDYITREGKSYQSATGIPEAKSKAKRPIYLRGVGPLYTYFFPFALTVLAVVKTALDFSITNLTTIFNMLVGLILICYNILYVKWALVKK